MPQVTLTDTAITVFEGRNPYTLGDAIRVELDSISLTYSKRHVQCCILYMAIHTQPETGSGVNACMVQVPQVDVNVDVVWHCAGPAHNHYVYLCSGGASHPRTGDSYEKFRSHGLSVALAVKIVRNRVAPTAALPSVVPPWVQSFCGMKPHEPPQRQPLTGTLVVITPAVVATLMKFAKGMVQVRPRLCVR